MNFWIIFLSLLIGATIGFEFGKYVMGKKIGIVLQNLADNLKKETEKAKEKRETAQRQLNKALDDLMNDINEAKKKKEQEKIDQIYELEPMREEHDK